MSTQKIFHQLNQTPEDRSLTDQLFPHCPFYLKSLYKFYGPHDTQNTAQPIATPTTHNQATDQSTAQVVKKIKVLFISDYLRHQSMVFNQGSQTLVDNVIKALELLPHEAETTVVKHSPHPPENTTSENQQLRQELVDKIYSVQPNYVVTLGAFASNFMLQSNRRLTELRGRLYPQLIEHPQANLPIEVLPLFHPDFLLINPSMKAAAWSDLQLILNHLRP